MRRVSWPTVRLEEVCEHITVGHVGPMVNQYVDSGVPFLRSQNVRPFRFDPTELKFISPTFHAKLKKSALRPMDVVVTRSGANTGQCCIIPQELADANCSDLVIMRPSEKINPWYLMYVLNSDWGRAKIAGGVVGAAQHHFNIGVARIFPIQLPPLPIQRRIAGILSAYDELIENSQRRIKILESMARALYREWFVHFRFPGHESVPRVPSPLGDIPRGWEVKKLCEIADNFDRFRKPLSKTQRAGIQGEYPYYGAAKVFDFINDFIFDGEYLLMAEDGSVITGDRSPVLQLVNEKFWPNNHTHVLQGRPPFSTHFLYFGLSQVDISPYITGAAQPKITQENMNRIPFFCGPETLHLDFNRLVEPAIRKAQFLKRQIQNLRRTRDLLLPRLLSGQIDVEAIAS